MFDSLMSPLHRHNTQILLQLLYAALNPHAELGVSKAALFDTETDWSEVCRYAARQGVLAIAWEGLNRLINEGVIAPNQQPSRELRLKWAFSVERIEQRYRKQRKAMVRLAKIYGQEGIEMTVLKGYGLSLCYPTPEHRACSDLDIWLGANHQKGDRLIREKYNIAIDEDEHHHTVFYIDGVMVENHYDFINIHAHRSSRHIERHLQQKAQERDYPISVDGATIHLPNANMHALFLLRHAASHFAAAEIVLRHLIDWAMFIREYHADIDWKWLKSVCSEAHMERFFDAMNGLAVEYCGLDEGLLPAFVRRKELEHRIIGDILSPEFSKSKPQGGLLAIVIFKLERWWANRWKHRLVYNENLAIMFLTQSWSHLLKPKSIKH